MTDKKIEKEYMDEINVLFNRIRNMPYDDALMTLEDIMDIVMKRWKEWYLERERPENLAKKKVKKKVK